MVTVSESVREGNSVHAQTDATLGLLCAFEFASLNACLKFSPKVCSSLRTLRVKFRRFRNWLGSCKAAA